MKPAFPLLAILAAVLACGSPLPARTIQTPGPADYGAFSRFVSSRNIFDSSRSLQGDLAASPIRPPLKWAESFTYTGSLSYVKGFFAFFDGNQPGLRQVLVANQTIADYTVTEISLSSVRLVSADQKSLKLMAGEAMHKSGGRWEKISPVEPSGASAAPTLTPDSAPNDILKRLMEQRQKESQ